jgi:hypothetical protein
MRRIRDARAAVDRGLERVNDTAADDWEEIRDGVDGALVRLRETIAEVRGSSGPMGGRAAGPN